MGKRREISSSVSSLSLSFVTNFPHSDRVYIYIYIVPVSVRFFFFQPHAKRETRRRRVAHSTASTDLVLDSDACTTTHSTLGIGLLILPLFSLSLSLSVSLCFVRARASFFARLFCSIVQLVHECSNLRGRRTLVVAHMFQSESCFRTNASNPRSITLFRQWRAQMTSRRQCVSRRCRDATLRWHQYWLTSHRMRRCRRRCSC